MGAILTRSLLCTKKFLLFSIGYFEWPIENLWCVSAMLYTPSLRFALGSGFLTSLQVPRDEVKLSASQPSL